MFVCVGVSVYCLFVCESVRVRVRSCVCAFLCLRMRTFFVPECVCGRACMRAFVCFTVCACVCVYMCVCACVRVYVCVCGCVCMYVFGDVHAC